MQSSKQNKTMKTIKVEKVKDGYYITTTETETISFEDYKKVKRIIKHIKKL